MVGFMVVVVGHYTKHVVVIRLDLLLLLLVSSVSKLNMWTYYGCVGRCCRPSVNIMCVRIMIGFTVVVVRQ
jgi:hypothetical protein